MLSLLGNLVFQVANLKLERLSFGHGVYLFLARVRSVYEKYGLIDHVISHPFVVDEKLRITLDSLVHGESGAGSKTPGVGMNRIGMSVSARTK